MVIALPVEARQRVPFSDIVALAISNNCLIGEKLSINPALETNPVSSVMYYDMALRKTTPEEVKAIAAEIIKERSVVA